MIAALIRVWRDACASVVRQPLSPVVEAVCDSPSYVLAQMVCAEILGAEEFKWQSDKDPPKSFYMRTKKGSEKTSGHEASVAVEFVMGDSPEYRRYGKACEEAAHTFRFKTERIELVKYVPYWSVYDKAYIRDYVYSRVPDPYIRWKDVKPFGNDFNERERKMIEAAIAKAEAQQLERDKDKQIGERQHRAADALAKWCGIKA
jgi:hypothetical protein